jgi:hypothetical protein
MPLNRPGALINFPLATQTLYRVTWDGYTIAWYITAENPTRARAKVRTLRGDRRLPPGLRVAPAQERNGGAPIQLAA